MRGRCFAVNYRSASFSLPTIRKSTLDHTVFVLPRGWRHAEAETPNGAQLSRGADPAEAPQYPFPCAIQDVLAAYLYLTDPPPDAPHRPVKPEHIVIAGDSAGGGLTLALLQILRDVQALQLPAGAALISPVSDSLWAYAVSVAYRKVELGSS